jgi:hypothetical protein
MSGKTADIDKRKADTRKAVAAETKLPERKIRLAQEIKKAAPDVWLLAMAPSPLPPRKPNSAPRRHRWPLGQCNAGFPATRKHLKNESQRFYSRSTTCPPPQRRLARQTSREIPGRPKESNGRHDT